MSGALRTWSDERADLLAWLEQRRDNAATIATNAAAGSEMSEMASDRRRQLDVIIDELRGGHHEGHAQVRADLLAARSTQQGANNGEG